MGKSKGKKGISSSLVQVLSQPKAERNAGQKMNELPEMPDGQTAEELALEAGISVKTIREKLKALLTEGRLEVGRKRGSDLIGREVWLPCYKMTEGDGE